MTPTKISSFKDQYAFLSNFYACHIEYQGLEFSSLESAFQAAKCANLADRYAFQYLTARDAKRQGRAVAMRPDWDEQKTNIMLELLFIKFGTNADMLRQLLATGDAWLVEENGWHDNFWGNCTCGRRQCVQDEGQNVLGQLLMSVRATYQHQLAEKLNKPA